MAARWTSEIAFRIREVARFLRDIELQIEHGGADPNGPLQVSQFFKYVLYAIDLSRTRLSAISKKAQDSKDELTLKTLLREIHRYQIFFSQVHFLLKEISEISIIESPSPFLIHLDRLLLRCVADGRVIAARSSGYNYSYLPLYLLNEQIPSNDIKTVALINYPFTESQSVLDNILLGHEIGHFVYEMCNIGRHIEESLGQTRMDAAKTEIAGAASKLSDYPLFAKELEVQIWKFIRDWWSELFSDLFASRVLGPSYLLAMWRFYHSAPSLELLSFGIKHPSFRYRISRIYALLRRDGWKSILRSHAEDVCNWLDENKIGEELDEPLADNVFEWPEIRNGQKVAYKYFDETRDVLIQEADRISAEVQYTPRQFALCYLPATRALEEIVPPNRVLIEQEAVEIDPMSVVASGLFFFLNGGLNKWYEKLSIDEDWNNDHYLYTRLNGLLLKALEDNLIIAEWGSNRCQGN